MQVQETGSVHNRERYEKRQDAMQSSRTSLSPDVREMWDEFVTKQDEPQYMRNVLSGLSGIMLVS